jgi:hypothetical protein
MRLNLNSHKAKVSKMAFFSRAIKTVICVTASLCVLKAMAADDDYLKMLENEAKDLEVDKTGQLGQTQEVGEVSSESVMDINWKSTDDLKGDVLPPGLTQEEFVEVLRKNFYGSFVFHQKLDSNDQQTVYFNYTKSSPAYLDSIRQDILDHLKNR